ncbi:MAG: long-chain fatty acid--CoA ligase [Rhodospirillaceae bacterium]|nr:long-chain fatty acid--CoA ligase [Rhodospirillaceae bacterium]
MDGKAHISNSDRPWLASYPDFADWEMSIGSEPAYAAMERSIAAYPEKICMEFLGRTWTYRETGEMIRSAAKGLQDLGVGKGDRMALMLPNTPYYIVMFHATLLIGGIVVNVNPLYTPRELDDIVQDSRPRMLVTMDLDAMYPKARETVDKHNIEKLILCSMSDVLPWRKAVLFNIFRRKTLARVEDDDRQVWFECLIENDAFFEPAEINCDDDLAVLQYTGGTTGIPKAAMLTHANVSANAMQVASWYDNAKLDNESCLAALPFFHVFAMTVAMMTPLRYGASIIMLPRFDLKDCLHAIDKKKPTFFPAVPTIFTAINTFPDVEKYDLSSIKVCISGGAPLPVEVKKEFERITGCVVVEGYGLSETSPVATTNPTVGVNKPGSVGIPMPGTDVAIRSLEDPTQKMPIGEKGEVCIYGPQVMKGYWENPEATDKTMIDGLFRTGDIGYIDEDGYVFLVDRLKDIIIASGYNIYPRNVEESIHEHPSVAEVTVIGVEDKYRGQTPKAFIKLREGASLTKRELNTFLKERLSAIERPSLVEFRDELPKTLIGKLSKKELKAEEKDRKSSAETTA